MSAFNGYSQATHRRIFALKNNLELVKLWVNAQTTIYLLYDMSVYGDNVARAIKTVELCEYTLSTRGLRMMLDGDTWTDGPIPAQPENNEQAPLF